MIVRLSWLDVNLAAGGAGRRITVIVGEVRVGVVACLIVVICVGVCIVIIVDIIVGLCRCGREKLCAYGAGGLSVGVVMQVGQIFLLAFAAC